VDNFGTELAGSSRLPLMIQKLRVAFRDLVDDEVGDVPGWVLITLMTAGLVVVIWAVAGPALSGLFEQAISRVSGF
jgi:hypothetical protein